MSKMLPVRTGHLMYKGYLEPEKFWKSIIGYLKGKLYEVIETKVKHKQKPFGDTIEYGLSAWKNVSSFFRFWMSAKIIIYDLNDAEVVKNGQKKLMKKGRVLIIVSSKIEVDYSNRFEGSSFTQKLRGFLISKIMKHRLSVYWWDQLDYKTLEFIDFIKKQLGMETASSYFLDMWSAETPKKV